MHPTRRGVLRSIVGGSLVLPAIMSELLAEDRRDKPGGSPKPDDPLAPKPPHFRAKAKRVIFLFSTGGVSHMDTFDYKPKLFAADGKTLGAGGGLSLEKRPLLKPMWPFRPGGQCGSSGAPVKGVAVIALLDRFDPRLHDRFKCRRGPRALC